MEEFKYALTGHTEGIGKALYERIGKDCKVFSRSCGFDITNSADRARIVEDVKDCNIFINNAYANFAQVDLMYELFDQWKDQDKLISNMGSDTTCGIKKHVHSYTTRKIALDKGSEQLAHLDKPCRVTNFRFGYIGTPKIISWYNPAKYIITEDLVEFITGQIARATKYRLVEVLIKA
jgi:hypothetical protein